MILYKLCPGGLYVTFGKRKKMDGNQCVAVNGYEKVEFLYLLKHKWERKWCTYHHHAKLIYYPFSLVYISFILFPCIHIYHTGQKGTLSYVWIKPKSKLSKKGKEKALLDYVTNIILLSCCKFTQVVTDGAFPQ